MNILLSIKSNEPLYEQIKKQISQQILQSKLVEGTQLPSIRLLAKTLQVGVITVKRAYDDLVNEGYLISKEAKGYFVNDVDVKNHLNQAVKQIKEHLTQVKAFADIYHIGQKEIIDILKEIYHD